MRLQQDCTTTCDHLKMASNTESDVEDEVTEEDGLDVNEKGKQSA